MYGMFWELHQHQRISQAQQAAQRSASKTTQLRYDIRRLNDRIDKLTLACSAMWALLEEKTDLTEDDLAARMEELDLLDGTPDGKVTQQVRECPQCGRTLSARHDRCLYCGAESPDAGPF